MIAAVPKARTSTGSTATRRRNEKRRCRIALGTTGSTLTNISAAEAIASSVTWSLSKIAPSRGAVAIPSPVASRPPTTIATKAVLCASGSRSWRWTTAACRPLSVISTPKPTSTVAAAYWPKSSGSSSLERTM